MVCSTCAGVIVALLGRELKSGLFEVEDYTFAGLARQEPLTTSMETDKEPLTTSMETDKEEEK